MTYLELLDKMEHAKTHAHMSRKKVGNNTYLEDRQYPEVAIALRLHATDILTWYPDGRIKFDTGGWLTVTTKARMNEWAGPFGINSVRGVWQIAAKNPDYRPFELSYDDPHYEERAREHYATYPYWLPAVPYVDGMVLNLEDPAGSLSAIAEGPDAARALELTRQDDATKEAVNKYLRGLTETTWRQILEDAQEHGTAGDCWYCSMVVSEGPHAGKPLGDAHQNHDHLREHLGERYYMASLALNAVKECGYPIPAVILPHLTMVKRSLRRYLLARLLVGPSGGRRGNAAPSWQDAGSR